MTTRKNILNWRERSLKIIQDACTPWGIKASLTNKDNYGAIFTRDAVMAGIVGVCLNDKVIIEGFKNTLYQLKTHQGEQGQIASNFKVIEGKVAEISFGTLSPKIDSCTWYLIGVGLLLKVGVIEKEDYKQSVLDVLNLLDALEFNGKHLIYIPKGGNWADEYVYEGYILYDQLLRIWGLSLLASMYENKSWSDKAKAITDRIKKEYASSENKHFDASFYPGGTFKRFDLAAHTLAGIVLQNEHPMVEQALDWLQEEFIAKGKLPPAFYPTIQEGDADWETLSNYHMFDFKNKPHHYHNGGIWFIWLGWLSVSLSLFDKKDALHALIHKSFSLLNRCPDFAFDEYFSSDELTPSGTQQLCYTASGIALLSLAHENFNFSILKTMPPLIYEPIPIKKEYFSLSIGIIDNLVKRKLLGKSKLVIGICGESGSGKSVTAKCLQIELEKLNIHSIILHQDSYYKLPPNDNHNRRKEDISWVGVNEVQLDLLEAHIAQFRNGDDFITAPVVDYEKNMFLTHEALIKNKTVLIVEGVYAFELENLDYKIFMNRTYKETMAKRKARNREIYDPFVEQVLEIEHGLIKALKEKADLVVQNDYSIPVAAIESH